MTVCLDKTKRSLLRLKEVSEKENSIFLKPRNGPSIEVDILTVIVSGYVITYLFPTQPEDGKYPLLMVLLEKDEEFVIKITFLDGCNLVCYYSKDEEQKENDDLLGRNLFEEASVSVNVANKLFCIVRLVSWVREGETYIKKRIRWSDQAKQRLAEHRLAQPVPVPVPGCSTD